MSTFKFSKTLAQSDVVRCLFIKSKDGKELREQGIQGSIDLLRDKQRWTVTLVHFRKDESSYICGGWRKFVRDNHVATGDTLMFTIKHSQEKFLSHYQMVVNIKYTSNTTITRTNIASSSTSKPTCLRRYITRGAREVPMPPIESTCLRNESNFGNSESPLYKEATKEPVSIGQEEVIMPQTKVSRAIVDTGSSNFTFIMTIQTSYLSKAFNWRIPRGVEKLMPQPPCKVSLECDCKKVWEAQIFGHCEKSRMYLHLGTGLFEDHQTRKGDLCIFEGLSSDPSKLYVHLYKPHHAV